MNDFDNFMDEANEFDLLFGCIHNFGLDTENELKFNGDVELARKYQEKADDNNALFDLSDVYDDNQFSTANKESALNLTKGILNDGTMSDIAMNSISNETQALNTTDVNSSEKYLRKREIPNDIYGVIVKTTRRRRKSKAIVKNQTAAVSTTSVSKVVETFNLPFCSTPKQSSTITTFQETNEPRVKYLFRALKLYQKFFNGGEFDNLEVLYKDIYSKDLLVLFQGLPPLVGSQKLLEQQSSVHRNIPDFCVFLNDITRSKHRLLTLKGNSFGTFAYANANDNTRASWNAMEYVPIEKMDEYHKVQKQKYDDLKSQNKVIRFERRTTWYFVLDHACQQFEKIMSVHEKVDIF